MCSGYHFLEVTSSCFIPTIVPPSMQLHCRIRNWFMPFRNMADGIFNLYVPGTYTSRLKKNFQSSQKSFNFTVANFTHTSQRTQNGFTLYVSISIKKDFIKPNGIDSFNDQLQFHCFNIYIFFLWHNFNKNICLLYLAVFKEKGNNNININFK